MPAPAIVIATDLRPDQPAWAGMHAQAAQLNESLARPLGITPAVELACLATRAGSASVEHSLGRVIDRLAAEGADEFMILPAAFEINHWQKSEIGEDLTEARRRHPAIVIHHDDADPAHPLVLDCLSMQAIGRLREHGIDPGQAGLLLVATGDGDPGARANAYRLMRRLWEQIGVARADAAFCRHPQPFLRDALERCLRDPLAWILLPLCQWDGDLVDYTRVILSDHQRAHAGACGWLLAEPPRDHPSLLGWLEQRALRLWQDKRARQAVRLPSVKRQQIAAAEIWSGERWQPAEQALAEPAHGIVGRARDANALSAILRRMLPESDRYLVKVTWHGYATGTFTSAAALDLLLGALPGQAVLLEGHTSGRNLGGADWDWEKDARPHRAWIRQQEVEFLHRTGIADVMTRHQAQYLNVTEHWWDEASAPAADVLAGLSDHQLTRPELAAFVPAALMEYRGTPFISFARFKGPTRLSISNLFGLIPHPLRTEWHGTGVLDFASACCDIARIYGSLFPMFGLNEAFETAVRWNRKGLYRSRWGNYDLVPSDGLFTLGAGLPAADILASRLQGQDVRRSGFFDIVRERLDWCEPAETLSLPGDVRAALA